MDEVDEFFIPDEVKLEKASKVAFCFYSGCCKAIHVGEDCVTVTVRTRTNGKPIDTLVFCSVECRQDHADEFTDDSKDKR